MSWIPLDQLFNEPRAVRYDDYRDLAKSARKPERREVVTAPQILYILDCGHVAPDRFTGIAEAFCYECEQPRAIRDVHVYEWKAYCATKRCTFSKWCGLSRNLAAFHANGHAHRHPDHLAKVSYRANPTAVRAREKLMRNDIIQ